MVAVKGAAATAAAAAAATGDEAEAEAEAEEAAEPRDGVPIYWLPQSFDHRPTHPFRDGAPLLLLLETPARGPVLYAVFFSFSIARNEVHQ